MKNKSIYFTIIFCFSWASCSSYASTPTTLSFSPASGFFAEIKIVDQEVIITIKKDNNLDTEKISIESEKRLSITTADYNFDGHQDFSISHLDDGMGTYTLYQIYVFSPQKEKFIPLKPKCGDEFINISVLPTKRMLKNSYFIDNQLKTCTIKY